MKNKTTNNKFKINTRIVGNATLELKKGTVKYQRLSTKTELFCLIFNFNFNFKIKLNLQFESMKSNNRQNIFDSLSTMIKNLKKQLRSQHSENVIDIINNNNKDE